jgi:thiosulfate dehydrogenase
MNCQNCHQEGGTKPFANNFSSVASIYPVFKARSGKLETVQIRINDCFERSLNGKPIPDSGKEMKAITAYIYWVGKDVPKGMKTKRSGTENLAFLKRAADTLNGKKVYFTICRDCHGENGGGKLAADGKEYQYPPLWGRQSYNVSAGMYQLSKFARFVKNNMPLGSTEHFPQISVEQAWDVAAFVNSKPRPVKYFKTDGPDISTKPVDYPFGPYSDSFSETQHKYGPFDDIQKAHKKSSPKT